MWPILVFLPWMAHGAGASSQALQDYLSLNPITTTSAAQSQSTPVNLTSLKDAVMAGKYTPSRPWQFLNQPCPGSCGSLGVDPSAWPAYHSIESLLGRCDETLLLDFSLYTAVDGSDGRVSIRSCTSDLSNSSSSSTSTSSSSSSCPSYNATTTETTIAALELTWDTTTYGEATTSGALDALNQLLAYENQASSPCKETIAFAHSGSTAVGVYIGSALSQQDMLAPLLDAVTERIESEGVTDSLAVQLCSNNSTARYTMGIMVGSDLLAVQKAVQTWRGSDCLTSLSQSISGANVTFSFPKTHSNSSSSSATTGRNSTASWSIRSHGEVLGKRSTCTTIQVVAGDNSTTLASECGITTTQLAEYNTNTAWTVGQYVCCSSGTLQVNTLEEQADGYCASYLVKKNDTCSALAAEYGITVADIDSYNNNTWGWMGCDDLLANEYICLSTGYPVMPAVISNAVCGPQVNGTATAPQGSDLSTLNECPLNACCDIWGQCGITADFCTPSNSTTGAPGTAANGTNGCISNCGTQIIESDTPTEYFAVGYFEGFDVQRPCLKPWITQIDTTAYTHIHMSFATLNTDFSYNLSSVGSQWEDFLALTDVKRILTVGGWSFSTDASSYDIFRQAVSSSANRQTLITNTIDLLEQWDLDGIDWDWEYPGEPDIPGIPADTDSDAQNFFLFLFELSQQMLVSTPDKSLSTTAPSSFWYMKAIPIEAISKVVDYIVLMTYDLHGQWDWNNTHTDVGCPSGGCLRSHVNLTETISSMSMITKAGVSSDKVVIGLANYARSFQMTEAGCYTPDCTFTGPDSGAVPGNCTQTAGYISNAELLSIAEDNSAYTYLDTEANAYIQVWNDTQWASYMDSDIAASRTGLYKGMNFLGTAMWAIDLTDLNGTSDSNTTSTCEIYIDPSVWVEASPTVTAVPGCTMMWPPMPLASNTTIIFPAWPTHLNYRSTTTSTTTWYDGSVKSYEVYNSHSVPTVLTIPPLVTNGIPVWFQTVTSNQSTLIHTSSAKQTPFVVTWTPTIGGTTVVSGGTTSTVSSVSWSSGNLTYATAAWVDIFGGVTSVVNGTVMPVTTTTVTPHPFPTTTDSTTDPVLNTRSTSVQATKSKGDSGPQCTSDCKPSGGCGEYCLPGCPECPPWFGIDISGGGGGGGGSGDGGDDSSSSSKSDSSSSSTSEESTITVAGATFVIADAFPTTTDAMTALEALESSEAGLIKSLYGAEMSYLITAVSNTATAQSTATPTTTANPYSITIIDSSGDTVACSSDLVLEYEGGPSTACVGDVSTISTHSTTSTTSTTAIPTPTGFGLMIFSDTNCEDYIDGYTWDSNGKCYDAGTEINSYIITTESDRCNDEENAIFRVWLSALHINTNNHSGLNANLASRSIDYNLHDAQSMQSGICASVGGNITYSQDSSCLPPVKSTILGSLVGPSDVLYTTYDYRGYYSPGIACPAGYSTACAVQAGADGIQSALSNLQSFGFVYSATADETAVGCCPTGYQCTNRLSSQWCQHVIASTTQPLITCINGTNGAPASSTTQFTLPTNVTFTYPDTLLSTEVTSTVTVTLFTMFATMIQMNFQATDLASTTSLSSTSLLPSSSLSTNSSSTGGSSNSSSSNHKTTTIAVSVVIPCVAILIVASLGWFWYRRRAKKQLSASYQAAQSAEPGPETSISYYGADTTSAPSEMLGSPARVEMEGSPVMYEMAGTDANAATVRHEMYAGR
ncbi:uncharacterized protein BHQ10_009106 [Talaromyces amestolkiae]|uniref:chitinase n=1 Tax=Talaromyces amestolkiae TaxID=1196081 RepID=A0A364LBA2_TALAM|nr:uncharacterized protein BHQ10_009106 [Talaromyces amestolkiae]RAO73094.1 hypothetical protein BHQ10_009106 [Talaromyces amestolkiae]